MSIETIVSKGMSHLCEVPHKCGVRHTMSNTYPVYINMVGLHPNTDSKDSAIVENN